MRKLYTDVTLETPFMVSYNDGQIQACANDEDTITIGAEEFIRVTDADGHNVSDTEGNQLLLNDGIIYKLVSGVPESTNITVTDVTPEPPSTGYTLTIVCDNQELTDVNIMAYDGSWEHSVTSSEGLTAEVEEIPAGTNMWYSVSASGYNSYDGQIEVNQNETITVTLTKKPQITLEAGLKLVDESGTLYLKDANDDYVLTDASTKVIFNTGSCALVEENTYYDVIDSNSLDPLYINPFTHAILISTYGASGYSLASCPQGNIEIALSNQGMVTIDSIALSETVKLYFSCVAYTSAPVSVTGDADTPTINNVIAGCYVTADIRDTILYDIDGNTGATAVDNQTETATLEYTATAAPTGTAVITFDNTGSINAATASLSLKLDSNEALLPSTVVIPASDVDSGTFTIQLRETSGDTYYLGFSGIGIGYDMSGQDVYFGITENETTNVTFTFEITQDE